MHKLSKFLSIIRLITSIQDTTSCFLANTCCTIEKNHYLCQGLSHRDRELTELKLTNYTMKTVHHEKEYLVPEVEVLEIEAEHGFAASLEDPYERDVLEW